MVQRQIVVRRPQRHSVPHWQIAPLFLLPPALIGAISLLMALPLTLFVYALGISCLGLVLGAVTAGKRPVATATSPAEVRTEHKPVARPRL
jgi:hypothetical protein